MTNPIDAIANGEQARREYEQVLRRAIESAQAQLWKIFLDLPTDAADQVHNVKMLADAIKLVEGHIIAEINSGELASKILEDEKSGKRPFSYN